MLSKEGLLVLPEKTTSILQLRRPTNVSEVKSFLGVVCYCRKFLKDVDKTLGPLNDLLRGSDKYKI